MNLQGAQIGLAGRLARVGLPVLAAVTMAGCSQPRPETPTTLVVPVRLAVATQDVAGVYDTVARYVADTGLVPDTSRTGRAQAIFTSRPARCSPNGDERRTASCVFSFALAQPPENPDTVAVTVRVRVVERVPFDPKRAEEQIRIEAALDELVTVLRDRFGRADVVLTDALRF